MKLDLKELLNKFLYMWEDWQTVNTTDTWVPVFRNGKVQHRVIPADADTTPTITNYNVYDSSGGKINIYRRGDMVTVKFNGVKFKAVSGRTEFATIPVGFRPITETGGIVDSSNLWFFCRPNGTIAINATSAIQTWGACTYMVQK